MMTLCDGQALCVEFEGSVAEYNTKNYISQVIMAIGELQNLGTRISGKHRSEARSWLSRDVLN